MAPLVKTAWYRTRADFLMRDRLPALERLLREFLNNGYRFVSVIEFWRQALSGAGMSDARTVVLRHDVDSDPGTARRMWDLERRLGIASTYYFRLSTVDASLMQEIEVGGGEASYHYEELATYAKAHALLSREQVYEALPFIRLHFRRNLMRLRQQTGLRMLTVASHGDFVNRALGISNTVILDDPQLREELNILIEPYDDCFLSQLSLRASDAMEPQGWRFNDPYACIRRDEKKILLLLHPRQWHANLRINFQDDVSRCWEGLRFRWSSRWNVA
jgi:hypothetical protein